MPFHYPTFAVDSVQPRVANDGARQVKAAATPGVLSAFDNILTVPPQVEGSKLSGRADARAALSAIGWRHRRRQGRGALLCHAWPMAAS